MLKMFIVHAPHIRSAVADYLPSGSPICSFGVTLAPKVLWGYKRQSAVCKSALRAFVPAICLSFGNNFRFVVGSVKQHSANIYAWCLKNACLRCLCVNRQKNHKNHSFHISISSSHRVSCSVFFIPENLFFDHSSF